MQPSPHPSLQRPLRIAVVTETYPPEVNGVATTLARVVAGLRERHHDLQLVRPRQSAGECALQEPGFEEVLLRGLPIPRYPDLKMGVPSTGALLRRWSRQRPDVVHIATEGPLGWSALRAALRLQLPVSSDFRTNFQAYSRHYGIGWLKAPIMGYLRHFHDQAGCTMVPTQALHRELTLAGWRRVIVVPRGVDTQRFDPALRSESLRQRWGAGPDTRVVLYVGRLAPEKNLATLQRAFEAMRCIEPTLKLVVVGDGPCRSTFQKACPDAVFTGQRGGADLATHYASADCFVFPSLTETFGNVTPEAMASGLPVLAYDHAAAASLIQSGCNGRLARAGDAADFVEAACELARRPAEARAMGVAARATARTLQWSQVVGTFEGVLRDTIATLAQSLQQTPALLPT